MEEKNISKKSSDNLENTKICKTSRVFIRIFLYQTLLSLFIVLFLFCFRFLFPSSYSRISEGAIKPVKNFNFRNFVNNTIFNLKEFFNNTKAVNSNCDIEKKETNYEQKIEENVIKNNDNKETLKTYYEGENLTQIVDEDEDDDVIFFNFMKPLKGNISSKYGARLNPLTKKQERDFHHGVDISVCDGTPICSIFDGIVQKVASSEKSGNFVFIKHGEFYESLYAHCSKILVSKGDVVKKGQKIALSGHSGNVTGAHLHLGIKRNGNWIDPIEVLPNLV